MKILSEYSVGVVPIFLKDNNCSVLLIKQNSSQATDKEFWTFPKGHPEKRESSSDTALRELEEETGVKLVELEQQRIFSITYTYTNNDKVIEKKVDYYIGYCEVQDLLITQPHEVVDLLWVSFERAHELLFYQNTKKVLVDVFDFLNHKRLREG